MSSCRSTPFAPRRRLVTLLLVAATLATVPAPATPGEENPPAAGFDLQGSDARAIEIADSVMRAMGGRPAWDATRYLTWNFFGRRRHLWDKHTGDLRVEGTDRESGEPYLILMNLHTGNGRAWRGGVELEEPTALAEMLELGESAWINDAYWLFMPYKLKDTGVTLAYAGEGEMLDGRAADVLELTFREVGRTPENRYRVYVARDSGLVEQWDFFSRADDEEPRFRIPWHDWRPHGAILLSADRGENDHTDVAVLSEVPRAALTSPQPVDWQALLASAE